MGNAESLLSQGLGPGVALPLPPGAAGSLQGLVAKCTALLAGQRSLERQEQGDQPAEGGPRCWGGPLEASALKSPNKT